MNKTDLHCKTTNRKAKAKRVKCLNSHCAVDNQANQISNIAFDLAFAGLYFGHYVLFYSRSRM